jgi:hypothetical protein
MDSFLSIFVATLQENEAACRAAKFGVFSGSVGS